MNERYVSILGTRYRITEQTEEENKLLKDCDGYCDWIARQGEKLYQAWREAGALG